MKNSIKIFNELHQVLQYIKSHPIKSSKVIYESYHNITDNILIDYNSNSQRFVITIKTIGLKTEYRLFNNEFRYIKKVIIPYNDYINTFDAYEAPRVSYNISEEEFFQLSVLQNVYELEFEHIAVLKEINSVLKETFYVN